MKPNVTNLAAVWFDLDGTLVDSAPDLVTALNRLLQEQGEAPIDYAAASGAVSKGACAILQRGFPQRAEPAITALVPRYLELYAAALAVHTCLYPEMDFVLRTLESVGVPWGVVTNKPGWLTRPLLDTLALSQRCAAVVTGDCLPVKKPDPGPLLHACELAQVTPGDCVYVGDDRRDIQAGQAAGMRTLAAGWGYLDGEDPQDWGAGAVIAKPRDLLSALDLA